MRAFLIIGVVLVAAGAGLGAQDPLGAAKDLYASAAYEDALSQLSRMDGGTTAPEIARQADEYRVFCLYALGRTGEAESLAETMIRKEPLAHLGSADASPRLELMFSDIRKRLMPSLIRDRFRTARSALDQKSFGEAGPQLTEARLMIVEAEKLGVRDAGLADLSVLVDGFLLLIRSSAEQQTSPQKAAGAPVAAATSPAATRPQTPDAASRQVSTPTPPAAAGATTSRSASVTPAASRPASVAPAAAAGSPRVYSIDDEGVSPPVAIDQRMPAVSGDLGVLIKRRRATGQVDVLIDETGRVLEATIRQSLNATFDALILQSARGWKYRPATKDGVPVRYVKTLLLVP